MLESYGSTEDSRRQYDVLVPLETSYGETMRARIWFLIRRHQIWARQLDPTGLATRSSFLHKTAIAKTLDRPFGLFRHLCTKTQPKCGLSPAGLTFGASQMHQVPIFRPFDVCLAVSDMQRSTPTTLSVQPEDLCYYVYIVYVGAHEPYSTVCCLSLVDLADLCLALGLLFLSAFILLLFLFESSLFYMSSELYLVDACDL